MIQINKNSKAKIVIVTGAENPSGLGIVQYFLRQDATVIVPAPRLHEITRLKTGTSNINKGSANIINENEKINKDEHIIKHEMLAKQIMQLCQGKMESPDEVFQSFTEYALH